VAAARRGGAGEVVDPVDRKENRNYHVVADEFEAGAADQVGDVVAAAGEEVVETDDVVAVLEESLAEVRADEARASGDENFHRNLPIRSSQLPTQPFLDDSTAPALPAGATG
jgi:hypothetical protein